MQSFARGGEEQHKNVSRLNERISMSLDRKKTTCPEVAKRVCQGGSLGKNELIKE